MHEIHLNAVKDSPAAQTETLECVLTTQRGHSSRGNMKLSTGYKILLRAWVNARVVFKPCLNLSCCFHILSQITPALAPCRFFSAMCIHFLWHTSGSQRGKKDVQLLLCSLHMRREPLAHGMLSSISSPDRLLHHGGYKWGCFSGSQQAHKFLHELQVVCAACIVFFFF